MFSNTEHGIFNKGEMLDANATYLLIKEILSNNIPNSSEAITGVGHYATEVEFQQALSKGDIDSDYVYFIIDTKKVYVAG